MSARSSAYRDAVAPAVVVHGLDGERDGEVELRLLLGHRDAGSSRDRSIMSPSTWSIVYW
jgi:hypothetical protein